MVLREGVTLIITPGSEVNLDPHCMHQMMNSKEAECPPIQMEPVDLSINKSRSSSPTLSISPELGRRQMSPPSPAESPNLIDLRMNRGGKLSIILGLAVLRMLFIRIKYGKPLGGSPSSLLRSRERVHEKGVKPPELL
ncbi:uncharacterized protein LOC143245998 [Tachypleus tridentatus]|uniref:uncharacterized protein LOC143245998 n=1 Tax=Tachypleus tridentatus TaxID=6853 RepID=UPI003FD33EC9